MRPVISHQKVFSRFHGVGIGHNPIFRLGGAYGPQIRFRLTVDIKLSINQFYDVSCTAI